MKAIILDTETTDVKEPEPIEIAYRVYGDGLSLSAESLFHSYFKPHRSISLGALAVHHIMDEDLTGYDFFGTLKYPIDVEYLVGHNIDFDWKVIKEPPLKRICTLALSRDLYPDIDSHSLSAMLYFLERETARERLKDAHSADADVGFCESILRHIISKLQVSTWEGLWIASESARIPKVMPFGKHKGVLIRDVPIDYFQWLCRQQEVDRYLMKAISEVKR